MVFGKGQKVYIVSHTGVTKIGKVVASPIVIDGVRHYNCMFSGTEFMLPESKLNPVDFDAAEIEDELVK